MHEIPSQLKPHSSLRTHLRFRPFFRQVSRQQQFLSNRQNYTSSFTFRSLCKYRLVDTSHLSTFDNSSNVHTAHIICQSCISNLLHHWFVLVAPSHLAELSQRCFCFSVAKIVVLCLSLSPLCHLDSALLTPFLYSPSIPAISFLVDLSSPLPETQVVVRQLLSSRGAFIS